MLSTAFGRTREDEGRFTSTSKADRSYDHAKQRDASRTREENERHGNPIKRSRNGDSRMGSTTIFRPSSGIKLSCYSPRHRVVSPPKQVDILRHHLLTTICEAPHKIQTPDPVPTASTLRFHNSTNCLWWWGFDLCNQRKYTEPSNQRRHNSRRIRCSN